MRRAGLLLVFFMATACATVTTGTHETINVESNPPSADATLKCDRGDVQHGVTPRTFTIRRNAGSCTLALDKEGFESGHVILEEGINGRYWANFAFTPLVPVGLFALGE